MTNQSWAEEAAYKLVKTWDCGNNIRMGPLDQIALEQSVTKALLSAYERGIEAAANVVTGSNAGHVAHLIRALLKEGKSEKERR